MRTRISSALNFAARAGIAFSVLCTGVLQSPALRHAHAGGDRPHSHAMNLVRGEQEFAPPHDFVTHFAAVIAVVPHVHMAFLGLEFTLPLPEGQDADQACGDGAPALFRLDDNAHPSAPVAAANPTVEPCAPLPFAASLVTASTAHLGQFPLQLSRCLSVLCDTARHERSGVQLA